MHVCVTRYRCLKCFIFDMCQKCFFSGQTSKSHKLTHPMQEYCSAVRFAHAHTYTVNTEVNKCHTVVEQSLLLLLLLLCFVFFRHHRAKTWGIWRRFSRTSFAQNVTSESILDLAICHCKQASKLELLKGAAVWCRKQLFCVALIKSVGNCCTIYVLTSFTSPQVGVSQLGACSLAAIATAFLSIVVVGAGVWTSNQLAVAIGITFRLCFNFWFSKQAHAQLTRKSFKFNSYVILICVRSQNAGLALAYSLLAYSLDISCNRQMTVTKICMDHLCPLCNWDSETLLHFLDKCAVTVAADKT